MPRMITITPSRIGWRVWTYQPLFTRTVCAIRGVTEVWRRSRHAATHKLSTLVEGGDPVSPASCGVGAQPFGCDEAAVGSLATVTAAGARSRHKIKGPSEVQDEVSIGQRTSRPWSSEGT